MARNRRHLAMSFFEELQANYERTVKKSEAARKERAEKEAKEFLLPVLEKHFRKRQTENPNASVLTVTVIATTHRQIKVEASQKEHEQLDKIYYDHCLGKQKGHEAEGEEKDLTSKEICEAMCRIAPRLYPRFRGVRQAGKEYAFEYTLTFVMPERP